jgi:hypothetical protein
MERHDIVVDLHDVAVREARVQLATWHDVSQWLDYGAAEFVPDATTRGYLHHVAQCVREEGERRLAERADLAVV